MTDLSIIIVNYNTCKMTAECVDSVIAHTRDLGYEIIVVDNASTDDSKAFFEHDSRIRYIYNHENLGFGRANNVGIAVAEGRNIFFLNSDTLMLNNAAKTLSDYLDAHPQVGAVGGNLYDNDEEPIYSYCRTTPSIWRDDFQFVSHWFFDRRYGQDQFHNHSGAPLGVQHINGADLMTRRTVLDEVGLFDERFFMYYEETELCHRIASAGHQLHSVPEARIVHLCGKSSKAGSTEKYALASRTIFFKLTGKSRLYQYADYYINLFILLLRIVRHCGNVERKRQLLDIRRHYKTYHP